MCVCVSDSEFVCMSKLVGVDMFASQCVCVCVIVYSVMGVYLSMCVRGEVSVDLCDCACV